MQSLIPVMGKVQDILSTLGSKSKTIDLPSVVVVGAQSSGKSSILETLVGKEFLPRGVGIVTRRPLVLQLTHVSEDQGEWGEFAHQPGLKFFSFDDIRDEIQLETDRVSGVNKGISATPIRLAVFSPHVVNLTLIDLPGLTKVPVGDQPSDIDMQIRRMVLDYITKPKSVILAVTPATTDLANSDALQMAQEVDPEGLRTIGVLTKLDLMDEGTDAVGVLCGEVFPLKLGFIGVINRSQQDIINGTSIVEALDREQVFFSRHPSYADMAYRCGTPYLSRTLNKILVYHIRNALPALRSRIHGLIAETENTIALLGEPINVTSEAEKSGLVLSSLTQFCGAYTAAIDGTRTSFLTNQLSGGARISYIFHDLFGQSIGAVSAMDALTMSDIRTVIRNATGPRRSLFVPEISFELLVKRQISRLEDPALQCVDFVFDELLRITREIEDESLARFGVLRASIHEVMSGMLARLKRPTMNMIRTLIQMELSYINTNHPDFLAGTQALATLVSDASGGGGAPSASRVAKPVGVAAAAACSDEPDSQFLTYFFGQAQSSAGDGTGPLNIPSATESIKESRPAQGRASLPPAVVLNEPPMMLKPPSHLNERELTETRLITSLLESYFAIVKKNIQDSVPKAIMLLLVNASKDTVQNELVSSLYQPSAFDDLLSEVDEIAVQRARSKELLAALNEAAATISEVMEWDAHEACEPGAAARASALATPTAGTSRMSSSGSRASKSALAEQDSPLRSPLAILN